MRVRLRLDSLARGFEKLYRETEIDDKVAFFCLLRVDFGSDT